MNELKPIEANLRVVPRSRSGARASVYRWVAGFLAWLDDSDRVRELDAPLDPKHVALAGEFDTRLGLYRRKDGMLLCGSCQSPLQALPGGWRCVEGKCGRWHADPDFRDPAGPPPPWQEPDFFA